MPVALHRKYRPQTVAELDQTQVRRFFEQILKTGRFGQAYLFTGPKGTGKTSGARILAKIVNCEQNRQTAVDPAAPQSLREPCNQCDSCLAITKGASSAVIEMDAASNRGIDDIRSLREQINLIPQGVPYAVYIIDEVHMLTTEAFNALLKTLEEPPVHAIFCLATTELHKLPATIVSRCNLVEYRLSTNEEIIRAIQRVAKGENYQISSEALETIAQKADGSFRDAVNLVQSLVDDQGRITDENLSQRVGTSATAGVSQLLEYVLQANAQAGLAFIEQAETQGEDMRYLSKTIIEHASKVLKQRLANGQDVSAWVKLIDVFSQSFKRFGEVPIPALPLEMAVVEYCLKNQSQPQTPNEPQPQRRPQPAQPAIPKSVTLPPVKSEVKKKPIEVKSQRQLPSASRQVIPELSANQKTIPIDISTVKSSWQQILQAISDQNHGLVTLMRRAILLDCVDGHVVVQVGYSFHKQQLEQERYLTIIEACLAQVLGGPVRFRVELGEVKKDKTKDSGEATNISGAIPQEDQNLVTAVEEAFGM